MTHKKNHEPWKNKLLFKILESGSNNLANHKDRIDALNVFPVPDGDTGSNMVSTVHYALEELKKASSATFKSSGNILKVFAKGTLFGARGNSGVIFSQIIKGFAVSLEKQISIEPFSIVQGFKSATDFAYKAVLKPVEGTILTVIKDITNELAKKITYNATFAEILDLAVKAGKKSVLNTPNLLPVLKEVGVVDSGGEGLIQFLEGARSAVNGVYVPLGNQSNSGNRYSFIYNDEAFEGEFGYCTEFIVELKRPRFFKKEKFQESLHRHGSSIVMIQDENLIKVHIHTRKPGTLLSFAQRTGEFIKLKCENMEIQTNQNKAAQMNNRDKTEPVNISGMKTTNIIETKKKALAKKHSNISVIAVAKGKGIINELKKSNVATIISGGQTANPSAKDFIDAIKSAKSKEIILLPNNRNIILTCQQAVKTITDKKIIVIPTKNMVEGLVASYYFDPESSLNVNNTEMLEAINDIESGAITTCIRDTEIDRIKVQKDQFLGIINGKIIGGFNSVTKAAIATIKKMIKRDSELLTIYHGIDVSKADAQMVADYFEKNTDLEIEIKNGGQDIYHFYFLVE